MATNPLPPPAPAVTLPGAMPPMPDVARILARHDRTRLAAFITVAVDLLDVLDGDPEAESSTWPEALEGRDGDAGLPEDSEPVGDERDQAWREWSTLSNRERRRPNAEPSQHEDSEEDDHAEEDDPAGMIDEDGVNTVTPAEVWGRTLGHGPGCELSDPDCDRGVEC